MSEPRTGTWLLVVVPEEQEAGSPQVMQVLRASEASLAKAY